MFWRKVVTKWNTDGVQPLLERVWSIVTFRLLAVHYHLFKCWSEAWQELVHYPNMLFLSSHLIHFLEQNTRGTLIETISFPHSASEICLPSFPSLDLHPVLLERAEENVGYSNLNRQGQRNRYKRRAGKESFEPCAWQCQHKWDSAARDEIDGIRWGTVLTS